MNKYLSIVILSQSDFVFRHNYILTAFEIQVNMYRYCPIKKIKTTKARVLNLKPQPRLHQLQSEIFIH